MLAAISFFHFFHWKNQAEAATPATLRESHKEQNQTVLLLSTKFTLFLCFERRVL